MKTGKESYSFRGKVLLQINSVVNSGSTGKIAEEIGQMAMANGWNSYIAYGRWANESQSKLIRIGSGLDNKWHAFTTRILDNHGLASSLSTKKFIKQIADINPNIIHLHNIHGYYLNYKILFDYLSQSNIPVVWTLHDCWSFTGHCVYFSFVNCQKWKLECKSCPNKMDYPKSMLLDRSKRNFAEKKISFTSIKKMHLVPVSNWLKGEVAQSFLRNCPVSVIHNGIDLGVFHFINTDVNDKYRFRGKFVILGVANVWDKRKGLDDFVRLSQNLSEDEIIVLIGLKKEQTEHLPSNIIGIQKTENALELAALYSSANLFFNPTWEDNFPTTNIEALACGTPVVTYKTGGSPESVNKDTGFVIEQGDLSALRLIINRIKVQGKRYYINTCMEHAAKNFNKEDRYKEYLSLYNELLK